jgi:hypothetical protein
VIRRDIPNIGAAALPGGRESHQRPYLIERESQFAGTAYEIEARDITRAIHSEPAATAR